MPKISLPQHLNSLWVISFPKLVTPLKRIYLHEKTKSLLDDFVPKTISNDSFIQSILAFCSANNITAKDLQEYLPEKSDDVPPEIEAMISK